MRGLLRTLAAIVNLSLPYFKSKDRWLAAGLLAAIAALTLVSVAVTVRFNIWNRDFFGAFQMYDEALWLRQVWVFVWIMAAQVALGMILIWLTQLLEIRWRQWMNGRYLRAWLDRGAHYRMQLGKQAVDNPDQRISMDIPLFIQSTLAMTVGDRSNPMLATGLLGAGATLASFAVILWNLSAHMPLSLGGHAFFIPGFLVWTALGYAAASTLVAHWAGRELIPLRFDQQRYEANFRFDLVRVRENSEQIALLRAGDTEQARLTRTFADVVDNWHRLIRRQVKLTAATASIASLSLILPSLLVAPAFFAHVIGFGELMQISSAFVTVQGALSFFVVQYQGVAEWKAVIDRLTGFEAAIAASGAQAAASGLRAVTGANGLEAGPLSVALPHGAALIETGALSFGRGDRVLVTGPTGSGKSTTLRAIAGIWPFAEGEIALPENATMMIVPQRPYLPIGPLADAVTFPTPASAWPAAGIAQALHDVGLGRLEAALGETAHWDRTLSPGEQQRLAVARALLHKPDYLFLDEATASLDEPGEAALYRLLHQRLPGTAIVSIGHRSTLAAFHARKFTVIRDSDRNRLVEEFSPGIVSATA